MASSTPTSGSSVQPSWWREWLKPIVVVAVISVLVSGVALLANLGVAALQSLKADIRDGNIRLSEEIRASSAELREEFRASNIEIREEFRVSNDQLREEFRASNAEIREEFRASNAEIREEFRASNDQLREEFRASNAELREEFRASEARQEQALKDLSSELKADNQALGERLDRVLEGLLTTKS